MNSFAISDTHFSHRNIIKYCDRPFEDENEMDEVMVSRWNAVVRPGDHVYHLGDVAIARRALPIVQRLNGKKRLIMGNHDIYKVQDYLAAGFQKIMAMRVFPDDMILTHVPIHPSNMGRFRANVHGHTHTNGSPDGPYVSVCVELTGYAPVSFEEIRDRIKTICA